MFLSTLLISCGQLDTPSTPNPSPAQPAPLQNAQAYASQSTQVVTIEPRTPPTSPTFTPNEPTQDISILTPSATDIVESSEDENAVYAALIAQKWSDDTYIITEQTEVERITSAAQQIGTNIPSLDPETLTHFQTQNQQASSLSQRLHLPVKYLLVSQTQLKAIFGRDVKAGWEEFYRRYPHTNGIYTVSRVGFNPARTQALVYFGNTRGWIEGEGSYVFLTKINGIWSVQNQLEAWVS